MPRLARGVLQGLAGRCAGGGDDLLRQVQRGRQQAGQLGAPGRRAQRRVGHGQAEEAGKAQGLEGGVGTLQGAAQGFAAHVDAKGRLHLGRRPRLGRRAGAGQASGQFPLVAGLQRGLPDFVGAQLVLALCEQGRGLAPGLLQRGEGLARGGIVLAVQQERAPGQADGQQLAQVLVGAAFQAGLPAQVGAP